MHSSFISGSLGGAARKANGGGRSGGEVYGHAENGGCRSDRANAQAGQANRSGEAVGHGGDTVDSGDGE